MSKANIRRNAMDNKLYSKCKQTKQKATVCCLDCKEFLCGSCHEFHDSWASLKEHKLLVLRDLCPKWKQIAQFNTDPYILTPSAITVHKDGDIAVTNGGHKRAVVFDANSREKFRLGEFHSSLLDVSVTSDKRFVFPDDKGIVFCDSSGKHLNSQKLDGGYYYDGTKNNMMSDPKTFAIDGQGLIIAGAKRPKKARLPRSRTNVDDKHDDRIFVLHTDGRMKSGLDTPAEPRSLTTTVNEEIIVSFYDKTLRVTNYSGNNWRNIGPPPEVTSWIPGPVCCSKQGEVYVINYGDTFAVYKYLVDGDLYLGCAINGLHNPTGIAISADGMKLYITEGYLNLVKIFERP